MKKQAQELIRIAYSLDAHGDDYQKALAHAMRFMGEVFSLSYSIRWLGGSSYSLEDWTQTQGDERYRSLMQLAVDTLYRQNAQVGERTMQLPPCYCAPRQYWEASQNPEGLHFYDQHFPVNAIGFACTTGDGEMFALLAGQERASYPTPKEIRLWAPVAAHLAAAWRIRRRLLSLPSSEPAAAFTPEGKLLHNESESAVVIQRLREAILRRELQLFRCEDDFALWPELIDGRWTLLDRFTSSGRRYVVALSNQGRSAEWSRLSDAERLVLQSASRGNAGQHIARMFNVSEAHASRLLYASMQKIGVASLVEAAQLQQGHDEAYLFALGEEQLALVGFKERSIDALSQLTTAERAVASDLLRGLSYKEIALRRGVSTRTVTNQIQSVFGKTNVSNRREFAALFSLPEDYHI